MNRLILALVGVMALPAAAQAEDPSIPQIAGQLRPGAAASAPADVRPYGRAGSGIDQVDRSAGRLNSAPSQLAPSQRSAEAAAPLSSVREGRSTGTAPIGGSDRCARPNAPGCEQIFEKRSAEFARPPVSEISPEARLLLNLPPAPNTSAQQAAQSLAGGRVEDSLAAEAIAAATNQPPPPPASHLPDLGDPRSPSAPRLAR